MDLAQTKPHSSLFLQRAPSASASLSSFARVLHGDVGQCLLHCLRLPELALLSRVSRGTLRMVQFKWANFKALDLTLYPHMPRRTLELLCASVSGVEALTVDAASSFMLQYVAGAGAGAGAGGADGHGGRSLEHVISSGEDINWNPFLRFASSILNLVDRNASSLVCVNVQMQEQLAPEHARALMPVFREILMKPLLARSIACTKLQALHLPMPLSNDSSLSALFSLSTARSEFSLLHRSMAVQRTYGSLRLLFGLLYPLRFVHRVAATFADAGMQSLRLCFPWAREAEGSDVLVDSILEQCRSLPAHPLDALTDQERAEPVHVHADADVHVDGGGRGMSVERLHLVFPAFRNLLYLSMQLYEPFLPDSVLRIELPCLLQLGVDCDIDANLADVQLHLPSLTSLNMHLEVRDLQASPRARDGEGQEGAEAEQPSMLVVPPTILASLARSPRLRFLCLPLCGNQAETLVPDFAPYLDSSMRVRMTDRASQLGYPSPFDAAGSSSPRIRLLLYALSVLACGSSLHVFEDCSPSVSMLEYLQLFPGCRSYASDPDFEDSPPSFFRPAPETYGLRLGFMHERILHRASLQWDRLSMHNRADRQPESEVRAYSTVEEACSYLTLTHKDARLTLASLQPIFSMRRFEALTILYLSAPTVVESSAVHALIDHCTELESLSLIQLAGVDDSCFYFEQSDVRRAKLRSLRLKNVCAVERARSGRAALSVLALLRCVALFPSLTTLDVTNFGGSASAVLATLQHLLSSSSSSSHAAPRWPLLRTLNVPYEAAHAEALVSLRQLMRSRAEVAAADPLAANGLSWSVGAVSTNWEPYLNAAAGTMRDDGSWFLHRRMLTRRKWTTIPGPAQHCFGELDFVELSCFAEYCAAHAAAAEIQQEPAPAALMED